MPKKPNSSVLRYPAGEVKSIPLPRNASRNAAGKLSRYSLSAAAFSRMLG